MIVPVSGVRYAVGADAAPEFDCKEAMEAARMVYGDGCWFQRTHEGGCQIGDGKGAVGAGRNWDDALCDLDRDYRRREVLRLYAEHERRLDGRVRSLRLAFNLGVVVVLVLIAWLVAGSR